MPHDALFRRLAVSAAAALTAASAWTSTALACSPPAPGATRSIQPGKEQAGVPRNTEIRVRYKGINDGGFVDSLPAPKLLDPDGKQVAIDLDKLVDKAGTVHVLRPVDPLQPGATYTIEDGFGTTSDQCSAFGGTPCALGPVQAGSFTTAQALDEQAPDFGGLTGFGTAWDECPDSACCGPFAGHRVFLLYTPATDDFGGEHLRYHVYRVKGGDKERIAHYATSATGATVAGFLAATSTLGLLPDGDVLEVCAIDLAGHEECGGGPQTFTAPPPPAPDPGPDAEIDAGGTDTEDDASDAAADADVPDAGAETVSADAEQDATGSPDSGEGSDASDSTAPLSDGQDPGDAAAPPPAKAPPADSGCTAGAGPGATAAWPVGLLLLVAWARRRRSEPAQPR